MFKEHLKEQNCLIFTSKRHKICQFIFQFFKIKYFLKAVKNKKITNKNQTK